MGPRNDGQPVLIVGLPRSGSTWLARVVSKAVEARLIYEPDNEKLEPLAWYCKRGLHRFPALGPMDDALNLERLMRLALAGKRPKDPFYQRLKRAFTRNKGPRLEAHIGEKTGNVYLNEPWNGGHRTESLCCKEGSALEWFLRLTLRRLEVAPAKHGPVVVKSVHLPLALEWATDRLAARIVVLLRNPFGIVASILSKRYPDGYRNVFNQASFNEQSGIRFKATTPVEVFALQTICIHQYISKQCERHPEWIMISHDRLCLSTEKEMNKLFSSLGHPWPTFSKRTANVNASPDVVTKWRTQLDSNHIRMISALIEQSNMRSFYREYVYV